MKVLAVLLLCAFVAVQGRNAVVKRGKTAAALGEHPWVVHLRIAVSTSGSLETAVGSLISSNWVLTAGDKFSTARFVWIRYGTLSVINPTLVTETSAVTVHSKGTIALVSINRFVEATAHIAPVSLSSDATIPDSGTFCGYGEASDGVPGETLECFAVTLTSQEDGSVYGASDDGTATEFDVGAPLVSDSVQYAILVEAGDDDKAGVFAPVSDYLEWIQKETELELK